MNQYIRQSKALLFISTAIMCISLHATPVPSINSSGTDSGFIEGRDFIILNGNSNGIASGNSLVTTGLNSGRIYDALINGFSLPEQTSQAALDRINAQYNWYKRNPEYMQRVWQRAQFYMHHIKSELQERELPMELALLPIVESAFDSFAYSHGRAAGLWQIIPGTGKYLGVEQNWWYVGRRDVIDSTHAALNYLSSLNREFDGDWMLAIAAYNSGAGNVRKGIRKNKKKNKALDFWSLDLPKETKAYVPKLLALKLLFLEDYSRQMLPAIPDQAFFELVETGSQIDLAMAADLAQIDLDTLYQLNPGFNHWATAPKGPHRLLVPVGNAPILRSELERLPPDQRVKLQRYKIKPGDTLSVLARKNKTTIAAIQQANNLNSLNLRAGKYILIPQASTQLSAYVKSKDARLKRLQNTSRKGQRVEHKVAAGDSFWKISQRFGVSERNVARWNGMAPGDTLKVGQSLVIWVKNDSQNSNINMASKPVTTRRINYKVRSGDTLSGIARKFKVKTSQIQSWNKSRLKKFLMPGQTLKIFVDVRQQSAY